MTLPAASQLPVKALLIGAILIPFNAAWQMMGLRWDIAHPSMISLLYNTISWLFLLTIFSRVIKHVSPRFALSRTELLTIYVMLSLSTAIGGHMCVQMLAPIVSYAFAYATPENDWQALFWRYIPEWSSVRDKTALDDFYRGSSSFYMPGYLRTWLFPLLIWSAFLLALFLVMLGINFIVRRQWTENEKLSYPLIQLPLAMTSQTEPFFRNRLMWMGFGVAAFIDLLDGLNYLYPNIPRILRGYNISRLFTEHPWNAIDWLPVRIYPFAVGLAFFMPLDLSFSCWFFYLFWKLQQVIGQAMGFAHDFPYATEQSFGTYVGLGISALWISRKHLWQVAQKVVQPRTALDDAREPMGYRQAVVMIFVSLAFLVGFCYKAGMSVWVVLLFFALYYALATGITRMRAELGSPVHDQHYGGPDQMLYSAFGSQRLGPNNLTMLSHMYFFNRAYDCLLMPHQLEGLKIAERAGIDNRKFALALVLTMAIAIPATVWAYMHISYQDGVYTGWVGREAFYRLGGWLNNPLRANYPAISAAGVGLVMAFILTFMRARFFWSPFHAAGYAVTSTYTMNFFWFSIFVSFVIKSLCLRHGGHRIYRRAIPFFLGLVLGEFVVTTFWGSLAIIIGRATYITIDL